MLLLSFQFRFVLSTDDVPTGKVWEGVRHKKTDFGFVELFEPPGHRVKVRQNDGFLKSIVLDFACFSRLHILNRGQSREQVTQATKQACLEK